MTDKLLTVELTNNDSGPRYAHTARGMEVVQSGETLVTEASATQLNALEDDVVTGTDDVARWTIGKTSDPLDDASADKGKALEGLTISKLRSIADAEGVQLTGRTTPDGAPVADAKSAKDIAAAILAHRDAPAG